MSEILADTDIPHKLYSPRLLALPLLLFCEGVTIYRYSAEMETISIKFEAL
jgi:hypothetical protein